MFSNYKRVYALELVMAVFYFAPFVVVGWSTDVWTRFARIQEWALAGFPLKETLMMSQNYPFGHEMHWTRPLDWIGYAFAWPFIPNWGLHRALEMMSCYVPMIVFLIGVRGFFYALRGYLLPKAMFFVFWLFFWGIGYVWGQSSIGYFDHHVFHFALLMWTLGFVMRWFLRPQALSLLIGAGILTAIGTWITAEFFINLYIVSVPFLICWLFYNRSLKPLVYYTAAYVLVLLSAMSFDHPIAGFWTLDFYRASLFHVILGMFNLMGIGLLMFFFKYVSTNFIRRFIYGVLTGIVLLTVLCFYFSDIFVQPMVDPFIRHYWIVHVGEMQPIYNSAAVITWVILPVLLAFGFAGYALCHLKDKYTPAVFMLAAGLLFYAPMMAFHVRVGISVNVFFVLTASLFFARVFFPREKGIRYSMLFVVFYLIFIGSIWRGSEIMAHVQSIALHYYYNLYKNNPTIQLPEEMQKDVLKKYKAYQDELALIQGTAVKQMARKQEKTTQKSSSTAVPLLTDKKPEVCSVLSDEAIQVMKNDAQNGAVMVELFSAPEILWKTGKPVLGGPYHGIVDGHKDLFFAFFERQDFNRVYQLIQKRHVTQIYLLHPGCFAYLFIDPVTGEAYKNLTETFYFALYNQTEKMPDWLELAFYNPKTGEKIFQVVEPKKKKSVRKKGLKK